MIIPEELQEKLNTLYPSMYKILPWDDKGIVLNCTVGRYRTSLVVSHLELQNRDIDWILFQAAKQQMNIDIYRERDTRKQYKLLAKKLKEMKREGELDLQEEFAFIDNYFANISGEQLYQELLECGLQEKK